MRPTPAPAQSPSLSVPVPLFSFTPPLAPSLASIFPFAGDSSSAKPGGFNRERTKPTSRAFLPVSAVVLRSLGLAFAHRRKLNPLFRSPHSFPPSRKQETKQATKPAVPYPLSPSCSYLVLYFSVCVCCVCVNARNKKVDQLQPRKTN
ncbi:hypothetical protein DFJ73DRAFT_966304, partial [Zopfochytrium polystomum]